MFINELFRVVKKLKKKVPTGTILVQGKDGKFQVPFFVADSEKEVILIVGDRDYTADTKAKADNDDRQGDSVDHSQRVVEERC